jgi:hypothetical protein
MFTDLLGHYNLKAPWRTCAIVAFAPCYLMRSETVEPGQNRYPTKDLALERDPECGGRRWADPEPPDRRAPTR